MRATLHAVPADDYLLLRPAVAPVFSGASRLMRGARPDAPRLARAPSRDRGARGDAAAQQRAARRASRPHGGRRRPGGARRAVVVGPADDAAPPGADRRPVVVRPPAADGRARGLARPAVRRRRSDGLELLVRRYLGALGPATVADLASWSKLPGSRSGRRSRRSTRPGELWHGRDEQGLSCSTSSTRRGPARTSRRRRACCRCGTGCCSATRTGPGSSTRQDRSRIVARQRRHLPDVPRRRARRGPVVDAPGLGRHRDRARAVPAAAPRRPRGPRGGGRRAGAIPRPPRTRRLRHVPRAPRPDARHGGRGFGPTGTSD